MKKKDFLNKFEDVVLLTFFPSNDIEKSNKTASRWTNQKNPQNHLNPNEKNFLFARIIM